MHLIELFLPLTDNNGVPFPESMFGAVEKQLAEKFGGATAYPRAPASGVWKKNGDNLQRDNLLVYEIIAKEIDSDWWTHYREKLEHDFKQERILIRSHEVSLL